MVLQGLNGDDLLQKIPHRFISAQTCLINFCCSESKIKRAIDRWKMMKKICPVFKKEKNFEGQWAYGTGVNAGCVNSVTHIPFHSYKLKCFCKTQQDCIRFFLYYVNCNSVFVTSHCYNSQLGDLFMLNLFSF